MILPVIAYGDPVLTTRAKEIEKEYPQLDELIENMFATMYNANGVGIAAPQVGLSIRLFVVDANPFSDDEEEYDEEDLTEEDEMLRTFKKVFINPVLLEESGVKWLYTEGCLSIPEVREDVSRKPKIKVQYFDENWVQHVEEYEGLAARIIQHEYDHLEGKLFVDYLSSLKKAMIKGRLESIAKGAIDTSYRMKFARKVPRR